MCNPVQTVYRESGGLTKHVQRSGSYIGTLYVRGCYFGGNQDAPHPIAGIAIIMPSAPAHEVLIV